MVSVLVSFPRVISKEIGSGNGGKGQEDAVESKSHTNCFQACLLFLFENFRSSQKKGLVLMDASLTIS